MPAMMERASCLDRVLHSGRRIIPGIIVLATLSGCAQLSSLPAPGVHYQCADGREFELTIAPSGDSASIEISRMQFALQAESPGGPGERYGCSVLTLWRDGELARVDMDGAPQFTNCRQSPRPAVNR